MKNNSNKRLLAAAVFGLSSVFLCTAYAATDKTTAKKPAVQNQKQEFAGTSDLAVQEFDTDVLNVQFRYKDGKLFAMRLLNKSKIDVQINILHEDYLLGPNDYVIIDPPKLKHLVIHHYPATAYRSSTDRLLSTRFGKHHIFGLPENMKDNITTKSVQKDDANQ